MWAGLSRSARVGCVPRSRLCMYNTEGQSNYQAKAYQICEHGSLGLYHRNVPGITKIDLYLKSKDYI
jgi:hypothetical protein